MEGSFEGSQRAAQLPSTLPLSREGGVGHVPVLSLELPYPNTSGNTHVRHGGGRHYLTKDALDYRLEVERQAAKHRAQLKLAGPLELRWVLAPPDERARDQTNVLKVVENALARCGVLSDDSNRVIRRTVVEWVPKVDLRVVRMAATSSGRNNLIQSERGCNPVLRLRRHLAVDRIHLQFALGLLTKNRGKELADHHG